MNIQASWDLQLSWDLHVHPGPSAVPRWGTGLEVAEAARRAGLRGFVWKAHERHTARDCRALPAGLPLAIGSASLNPWATPPDVAEAIADGARWVWGPTRRDDGTVGWDLPLPAWWPPLRDRLAAAGEPLVLATGHLDAAGRRALAELAAASAGQRLRCSVTHALFVPLDEVRALRDLGCAFEVDLYTGRNAAGGRPPADLAAGIARLVGLEADVYVTTDAGQPETGDPYAFSARELEGLAKALGEGVVGRIARDAPERLCRHVLGRVAA